MLDIRMFKEKKMMKKDEKEKQVYFTPCRYICRLM